MNETSPVEAQLLLAAVETASIHGIAKMSMGDVARRAGLSRQTLYRHFASKEILVAAVIRRETTTLIAQVVEAGASHDDPTESLEASLLAALLATRQHPLLDRLVRTEPESLLPLLTTDGGPVMGMVRATVEYILSERVAVDGVLDASGLRRFADIVTRLLVSYAISAPDDPPEEVAAAVASILTMGALRTTTSTGASR